MVERIHKLDTIFASLSDPTRRDILARVRERNMSVGTIARHYEMSLAAVAKHLAVLERAGLVHKTRQGKEQVVTINPKALAAANEYLETYRQLWEKRLDSLDSFIKTSKQ
jgi:DNA-binding transcriptional ArsR family regulator